MHERSRNVDENKQQGQEVKKSRSQGVEELTS
jgi:hypothetical protein